MENSINNTFKTIKNLFQKNIYILSGTSLFLLITTLLFYVTSCIPVFWSSFLSSFCAFGLTTFLFYKNNDYLKKYHKYFVSSSIILLVIFCLLTSVFCFTFYRKLNKFVLSLLGSFVFGFLTFLYFKYFKENEIEKNSIKTIVFYKFVFNFSYKKIFILLISIFIILIWLGAAIGNGQNTDLAIMSLTANEIINVDPFLGNFIQGGCFLATDQLPYNLFVSIFGVSKIICPLSTWLMISLVFLLGLILVRLNKNYKFEYLIIYLIYSLFFGSFALTMYRVHTMATVYGFIVLIMLFYFSNKKMKIRNIILFILLNSLVIMSDITYILFFTIPFICYFLISLIIKNGNTKENIIKIASLGFSIVIGYLFLFIYRKIGGSIQGETNQTFKFVSPSLWVSNISTTFKAVISMYGTDPNNISFITVVIIIIFTITLISSLFNIISFIIKRDTNIIPFTLSISFIVFLAFFVMTDVLKDTLLIRYYQSIIFISSIIIIFTLSKLFNYKVFSKKYIHYSILIMNICLPCIALINCHKTTPTLFKSPVSDLDYVANVLEQNNLKNGFACFWVAEDTQVRTNNKVNVRHIIGAYENEKYYLRRMNYYESNNWFNTNFNFIIVDNSKTLGTSHLSSECALSVLGTPTSISPVNNTPYEIMIYNYDISTKVQGCPHFINA